MFNFTVDKNSPVPYYYQIEEWIRGLIVSEQLKPGDMLLNEINLSEQVGVSRMTVRQALDHLTREGLLTRQRAKGTFVASPRAQMPFNLGQPLSMTEEILKQGQVLRSRVLTQEVIPAAGEILRELELPVSSQVLLIRRLRSTDQGPLSIESCHHPYQRFPELLKMDLNNRSIYEILDERYQARPVEAIDKIYAGKSTPEEARLLEIEAGDPVMHFRRTAKDSSGQPVEFTRAVYRADRYQFVIRYCKSEMERA